MLNRIEEIVTNPFYSPLFIYVVILILVLYSFDMNCSIVDHIKFFVYIYGFLVLYSMYLNNFYDKKITTYYRYKPTPDSVEDLLKVKEDSHSFSSASA